MARKGNSLQSLINETPSVEQLAWNHNADISASVYKRMRELNITQGTLAKRMKMHLVNSLGCLAEKEISQLRPLHGWRRHSAFALIPVLSISERSHLSWKDHPLGQVDLARAKTIHGKTTRMSEGSKRIIQSPQKTKNIWRRQHEWQHVYRARQCRRSSSHRLLDASRA